MKNSNRLHYSVCFLATLPLLMTAAHFAYAFSSNKPKAPNAVAQGLSRDPAPHTEQWLSTLNREGTMGIDSESEERQAWLRKRAREFSDYIRKPASHRAEIDGAKCDANDPFCFWMRDSETA